jgi:hypothetical protein
MDAAIKETLVDLTQDQALDLCRRLWREARGFHGPEPCVTLPLMKHPAVSFRRATAMGRFSEEAWKRDASKLETARA